MCQFSMLGRVERTQLPERLNCGLVPGTTWWDKMNHKCSESEFPCDPVPDGGGYLSDWLPLGPCGGLSSQLTLSFWHHSFRDQPFCLWSTSPWKTCPIAGGGGVVGIGTGERSRRKSQSKQWKQKMPTHVKPSLFIRRGCPQWVCIYRGGGSVMCITNAEWK